MGIPGLIPLLKSITKRQRISQYANQTVAIDAYCWLHRGIYSCSTEICQGIDTGKYVSYCMNRVRLLLHYKIKPILVFDGGILPIKNYVEEDRRLKRKKNKTIAMRLLREGNTSGADRYFKKAVDITPDMAQKLIQKLREEKIEFIVAPYEADAQLAFLSRNKLVDVVISEDSDLIPYGCAKVLFKMDSQGVGEEIELKNLGHCSDLDFVGWDLDDFTRFCIFTGCDYLHSISGIGIKTAYKLFHQYKNISQILRRIRMDGKHGQIPHDYADNFERAFLTFRHQLVFDPTLNKIVPLSPFPMNISSSLEFLGAEINPKLGLNIATGVVDPLTKIPFADKENAALAMDSNKPIHEKKRKRVEGKNKLPVQTNTLDSYFQSLTPNELLKKPFNPPRNHIPDRIYLPNDENDIPMSSELQAKSSNGVRSKYFSHTQDNSSQINCDDDIYIPESDDEHILTSKPAFIANDYVAPSKLCSIPSFSSKLVANRRMSIRRTFSDLYNINVEAYPNNQNEIQKSLLKRSLKHYSDNENLKDCELLHSFSTTSSDCLKQGAEMNRDDISFSSESLCVSEKVIPKLTTNPKFVMERSESFFNQFCYSPLNTHSPLTTSSYSSPSSSQSFHFGSSYDSSSRKPEEPLDLFP